MAQFSNYVELWISGLYGFYFECEDYWMIMDRCIIFLLLLNITISITFQSIPPYQTRSQRIVNSPPCYYPAVLLQATSHQQLLSYMQRTVSSQLDATRQEIPKVQDTEAGRGIEIGQIILL